MWPLREKSLLRFGLDPLLLSQLQQYRILGFNRVVIVANLENSESIRELVSTLPIQVTIVIQPEPKGMGDALLYAETALLDQPETPIYITQVHDVVDESLHRDMLAHHRQNPQETYLAGIEMAQYFPGGYLQIDSQGRIHSIIEKPGAEHRPSNLVNIVAHIHPNAHRLFEALRAEYASSIASDDHYERAMDKLMKQQVYRVVPYRGHWSALKYPWHVLDVMEYYLSKIDGQHIAPNAYVAPTATVIGNVFIGENVKIFPGAAVVGPAFIGKGTIIGNNALVRASMVLNECEVGFTTEVARSYVADRCSMHACRVLDSIFAHGVNFSAGCTTANLRIDRESVQVKVKGQRLATGRTKLGAIIGREAFLAVDVMTMPGVKVGERARIGPGTHVHQDVRDSARIYVKQEQIVIEE
jgi:bifunctional UDP-N-acetylglucosamine pyrophosphorylase/glucosamine-1-phosphate N-acetyltransferase